MQIRLDHPQLWAIVVTRVPPVPATIQRLRRTFPTPGPAVAGTYSTNDGKWPEFISSRLWQGFCMQFKKHQNMMATCAVVMGSESRSPGGRRYLRSISAPWKPPFLRHRLWVSVFPTVGEGGLIVERRSGQGPGIRSRPLKGDATLKQLSGDFKRRKGLQRDQFFRDKRAHSMSSSPASSSSPRAQAPSPSRPPPERAVGTNGVQANAAVPRTTRPRWVNTTRAWRCSPSRKAASCMPPPLPVRSFPSSRAARKRQVRRR